MILCHDISDDILKLYFQSYSFTTQSIQRAISLQISCKIDRIMYHNLQINLLEDQRFHLDEIFQPLKVTE